MASTYQNRGWGIALILLGTVLLIGNLTDVGMDRLWPLFPMAVGIAFWTGWFLNRRNTGFVMPGTILVVLSLLFFYCNWFGWDHMNTLWPVYILAPGLGFVAMYLTGGRQDRGQLVPALILGLVSVLMFFFSLGFSEYWPVFLIMIGIFMVLLSRRPIKSESDHPGDSG